jgi:hypothetical protein
MASTDILERRETNAKIYRIINSQKVKSVLAGVSSGAASLRESWTRGSGPIESGSLLGDEEFGFDDLVINSTAYRRVFVKQKSKYHLQGSQDIDDEADIIATKKTKSTENIGSRENMEGRFST